MDMVVDFTDMTLAIGDTQGDDVGGDDGGGMGGHGDNDKHKYKS